MSSKTRKRGKGICGLCWIMTYQSFGLKVIFKEGDVYIEWKRSTWQNLIWNYTHNWLKGIAHLCNSFTIGLLFQYCLSFYSSPLYHYVHAFNNQEVASERYKCNQLQLRAHVFQHFFVEVSCYKNNKIIYIVHNRHSIMKYVSAIKKNENHVENQGHKPSQCWDCTTLTI